MLSTASYLKSKHCVPGSDAGTLVRILTNRSNAQRQVIAKTYEDTTQKVKKTNDQFIAVLLTEFYYWQNGKYSDTIQHFKK